MRTARGFDNNRRPQWWGVFLSLLVALVLVAQPVCFCAAAEGARHLHAAAPAHAPAEQHATAHHDHHNLQDAHPASTRAAFGAAHGAHFCCCDNTLPPAVAIAAPRFAAPQDGILLISAPAILPAAPNVFPLTNCHGRDGPNVTSPLFSQFLGSSLSGRAPPLSL